MSAQHQELKAMLAEFSPTDRIEELELEVEALRRRECKSIMRIAALECQLYAYGVRDLG